MRQGHSSTKDVIVLVNQQNGVTLIPAGTPLTRLNYFDGKFLRAADLQAEQEYLRNLVFFSNQAGGSGVAYGYDVVRGTGDSLTVGPGLAIDPMGRVLVLTQDVVVSVTDLIKKQSTVLSNAAGLKKTPGLMLRRPEVFQDCEIVRETGTATPLPVRDLYLITIGHAEGLCGQEDVYGKLCEEACITSKDRPYRVEGVVIRAVPLTLRTPLAKSGAVTLTKTHLRSLVASAYYEDERQRIAGLISGAGLRSNAWCLGADAEAGQTLPIAVVSFDGTSLVFLDAWIARRERIDAPAKRYWQWRMAMRPWDVYLAQILQFQCQLHNLFEQTSDPGSPDDPCQQEQGLIREAADTVEALAGFYKQVSSDLKLKAAVFDRTEISKLRGNGGLTKIEDLQKRLFSARKIFDLAATQRRLIRGGIVELPAAGYLPVVPGTTSVNKQVRALLGEGVDLRFCVVRHDFVAHALEEAQHMERISLLQGLDNPNNKPEVDILVPDGKIVSLEPEKTGLAFEGRADFSIAVATAVEPGAIRHSSAFGVTGAARGEKLGSGGGRFCFAGAGQAKPDVVRPVVEGVAKIGRNVAVTEFAHLQTTLDGLEKTPVPTGPTRINSSMRSHSILAANLAARVKGSLFDRLDVARPLGPITISPGLLRPVLEIPETDGKALIGLWVEMQCEKNLLELSRGETTRVDLKAFLEMPSQQGVELNWDLHGDFAVHIVQTPSAGRRTIQGMLSLYGSTQMKSGPALPIDKSSPLTWPTTVEFTSTPTQSSLVINAQLAEGIALQVKHDGKVNGAGKQEAQVTVNMIGQSTTPAMVARPIPLLQVSLTESTQVLSPTNDLHALALRGIQVIGAALADAGFADAKTKLLFPPAQKPREELTIEGTRDWVLFHRRRNKQCAVVDERPVVMPRRYQVYRILLPEKNMKKVDELRNLIVGGQQLDPKEVRVQPITQVEFEAGIPTLLSSPDTIRADWQAEPAGNRLLYAAIATVGRGDGEDLALQRLSRLHPELTPVTVPDSDLATEELGMVPESLAVSGTDGVILLMTYTALTTHAVFAMKSGASMGRVLNAEGVITHVLTGGPNDEFVVRLGDTTFAADSGQLIETSIEPIVTAWQKLHPGRRPGKTVVLPKPGEQAAIQVYIQQATAIVSKLGGSASTSTPTVVSQDENLQRTETSPVITLIEPASDQLGGIRNIRIILHRPDDEDRASLPGVPELTAKFNPDGSLAEVPPELKKLILERFESVEGVRLVATDRTAETTDQEHRRLEGAFTALKQEKVRFASVPEKELTIAERPLFEGGKFQDVLFITGKLRE